MEKIGVNYILPHVITKVNCDLTTREAANMPTAKLYRQKLEEIIDDLGARSAKEQGLKRILTTSEKLRNSDHTLYLLKDPEANNGAGEAIGLLKVGRKKLFLYDEREKVVETEPLCVLDFFVSCQRQRRGLGKKLFDYMLHDQNMRPEQLAIDGPSGPMNTFLMTHYGFKELIRQSNNFAVHPDFFHGSRPGLGSQNSNGSRPGHDSQNYHESRPGHDSQNYHGSRPGHDSQNYHGSRPGHDSQNSHGSLSEPDSHDHSDQHRSPNKTAAPQAQQVFGRFAARHRPTQMGNLIQGGDDHNM